MNEPSPTERTDRTERTERSEAEALRALQERLNRAAAAAQRLLCDAASTGGPPPGGWQRRDPDGARDDRSPLAGWIDGEDGELLLALLAGVRDRIPAELQQRLAAALREVLLALRALIDWCLERSERRRTAPAEVQDIPIL
jgi:hypothetical protein